MWSNIVYWIIGICAHSNSFSRIPVERAEIKCNLKAVAKSMQQFCAQLPFNSRQQPFCCLQPLPPVSAAKPKLLVRLRSRYEFQYLRNFICISFNLQFDLYEIWTNFKVWFCYFRNFSTLIEAGNTTAKCRQLRIHVAAEVCDCVCVCFGGTWQQPSAFVYYLVVCTALQPSPNWHLKWGPGPCLICTRTTTHAVDVLQCLRRMQPPPFTAKNM